MAKGWLRLGLDLLERQRVPILLLLVGVFLPLWGFGELAEEVWEKEGFPWDLPILRFVHQGTHPGLDQAASLITQMGGFWGVTTLSMLVGVILLRRRQWRSLLYLLVAMGGNGGLNRLAKATLQRVRPQLWQSPAPEFDYGFPSGHAMASMAFVATVVILSWRRPWRGWVVGVGAVYVLMIAWTRLYLGVHYPSDILAGWLASVAWTVGTSLLIRPAPAAQEQIEAGSDLNRP